MRRFKNKVDAAKALMPAALAVLELVSGMQAEFVLEPEDPVGQEWTCPICGDTAHFWWLLPGRVGSGWRAEEIYECARCFSTVNAFDYEVRP